MQDLRTATASELLTLEEEYDMQRSWRNDVDKLTFISCLPAANINLEDLDAISPERHDGVEKMVGDVNLFVTTEEIETNEEEKAHADLERENVIGEVELMVAQKAKQGQGLGKASLLVFLHYIAEHEERILAEYGSSFEREIPKSFRYLRVKIGQENFRSLKLFQSVGFVKIAEEPNYFGEVEMRLESLSRGLTCSLLETYGIKGYKTVGYE